MILSSSWLALSAPFPLFPHPGAPTPASASPARRFPAFAASLLSPPLTHSAYRLPLIAPATCSWGQPLPHLSMQPPITPCLSKQAPPQLPHPPPAMASPTTSCPFVDGRPPPSVTGRLLQQGSTAPGSTAFNPFPPHTMASQSRGAADYNLGGYSQRRQMMRALIERASDPAPPSWTVSGVTVHMRDHTPKP